MVCAEAMLLNQGEYTQNIYKLPRACIKYAREAGSLFCVPPELFVVFRQFQTSEQKRLYLSERSEHMCKLQAVRLVRMFLVLYQTIKCAELAS